MALATWKAALTRSVTENCLSGSSEGVNHVGSYQPLLFLRNCSMFPYGQYSMITHKSQWRPMSQMRTQLGYWINNPTYPLILSPLVVVWTGEDLDTDRSDRTHRTAANFSTHTWYRSIHPNQLRYKSHTWETQLVAMSLTFLKQWCMLFKLPSCTHETGKVNKDQFLPTYPSPTPTLSLTSHYRQNVGLGRGRWSVSREPELICQHFHVTAHCSCHENDDKTFIITNMILHCFLAQTGRSSTKAGCCSGLSLYISRLRDRRVMSIHNLSQDTELAGFYAR